MIIKELDIDNQYQNKKRQYNEDWTDDEDFDYEDIKEEQDMYYYVLCRGMFNDVVYNSAEFDEIFDTYNEAKAAAMSCAETDRNLTYFIYPVN